MTRQLGTALIAALITAMVFTASATAVDHNNVDSGRPLRFDDAESLAFREFAFETGLLARLSQDRRVSGGFATELLHGFAMNSHLIVGTETSVGRFGEGPRPADHARRGGPRHPGGGGGRGRAPVQVSAGDINVGLFHNLQRDHGNTPALAVRGDLFLPTGEGSDGVQGRFRAIASRQAGRYGRAHLNLDLNADPDPGPRERQVYPSVLIGFTHPLGYPAHFQTTGLAELNVLPGSRRGRGPVVSGGLGVRKQIGFLSVLDLGLQFDLTGSDGAVRDRVRGTIGFSVGF